MPVEIDQLWNEDIGHALAFDDAHDGAAEEDAVHVERDLRAERRGTQKAAEAGHGEAIDSLAEHRRNANAFEGEISAAQLLDFLNGVAPLRIVGMGRAEFARKPEPVVDQVDGVNRWCSPPPSPP